MQNNPSPILGIADTAQFQSLMNSDEDEQDDPNLIVFGTEYRAPDELLLLVEPGYPIQTAAISRTMSEACSQSNSDLTGTSSAFVPP